MTLYPYSPYLLSNLGSVQHNRCAHNIVLSVCGLMKIGQTFFMGINYIFIVCHVTVRHCESALVKSTYSIMQYTLCNHPVPYYRVAIQPTCEMLNEM